MGKLESASEEELSRIEGIGPIVAEAIHDFMENPRNRRLIDRLRKAGLRMELTKRVSGPLSGKVFLFTGELESMARPEAEALVQTLGGRIASGVTKALDYLVVGKEPGSKLAKAKSLGKTVLDERAFLEMVRKK
jgi:DNA ligase (NAD+)